MAFFHANCLLRLAGAGIVLFALTAPLGGIGLGFWNPLVSDRRLRPPLVLVGGSPPSGTIPPGIGHYLLRQSGFRQLHSQAGFKMGIPIRIAPFEFPSLVGLGLGFHNPSHSRRSADDPAQRLSYAVPPSPI